MGGWSLDGQPLVSIERQRSGPSCEIETCTNVTISPRGSDEAATHITLMPGSATNKNRRRRIGSRKWQSDVFEFCHISLSRGVLDM